jgi:hypothetical protein
VVVFTGIVPFRSLFAPAVVAVSLAPLCVAATALPLPPSLFLPSPIARDERYHPCKLFDLYACCRGRQLRSTPATHTLACPHLLDTCQTAAFNPGDRVAMASPGYPCYRNILGSLGVDVVLMPVTAETNWQVVCRRSALLPVAYRPPNASARRHRLRKEERASIVRVRRS